MGWKKFKEHFGIKHTVHIVEGQVCIGSAYISQLLILGSDGRLVKRDERSVNEDIARYQREIDADPAKVRELLAAPDLFAESIPVFTYDGSRIIEKMCEKAEWPNCTHDGQLMYDNTFSTDKSKVIAWAKRNADAGTASLKSEGRR